MAATKRRALFLLPIALGIGVFAFATKVPHPANAVADQSAEACVKGLVWRNATPGDHVCVTPQVHDQVVADNAQAAARRASLNIKVVHWTLVPGCKDGCTASANERWPRFEVLGDHFNLGKVRVGVFRSRDNKPIWSTTVVAVRRDGVIGGSFDVRAQVVDCVDVPGGPRAANSYVAAYDETSGHWSKRVYVWTGCTVR